MHLRGRLDDLVPLDLAPHHERVHRPLDVVRRRLLRLKNQAVGESVSLILLECKSEMHNLRVVSEKKLSDNCGNVGDNGASAPNWLPLNFCQAYANHCGQNIDRAGRFAFKALIYICSLCK